MSVTAIPDRNELKRDVLRELGNVGLGNALTALSTMVDRTVNMSVPRGGIVPMAEFTQMAGGPEAVTAAVYMPVTGDAPGHVAFLLPHVAACRLADYLMGLPLGTTEELGEIECSALREIGNIVASSFLVAICEMTGLNLYSSPPELAVDMAAAILSTLATVFDSLEDLAITIVVDILEEAEPVEGYFLYVPEPDSLSVILRALQMEE